ncbi:hypothetical protein BBJ29_004585 [Phytophthora kernoviae]|uniref:Major facilitator superfamily (MFS) profile domain-containing protein n=1 Tax=Phytophthora kernoviae TaxID=325452 RepID=A0A3F2RM54_9STRA|nr:hypothetical protein BBJ29_004585 [Phytophthora kernoviae]RLN60265.1 hypothetical protein BBP00_00006091 [Phytophthora kernoviae]
MNLSQCNDTDECNARPVAEDTCLMFPGHSKLEWTFAVNAWLFGAMVGSLCCGHFIDNIKRVVNRLIAGISSGMATSTIGNYVNELSPPHIHNTLGLQIFMTISCCLVFHYSGSIFLDAGISDSHVGTLIVNSINIWPAFFTGVLANCFDARNMILWGLADMVAMSIGMDDGR